MKKCFWRLFFSLHQKCPIIYTNTHTQCKGALLCVFISRPKKYKICQQTKYTLKEKTYPRYNVAYKNIFLKVDKISNKIYNVITVGVVDERGILWKVVGRCSILPYGGWRYDTELHILYVRWILKLL